MATAQHQNVQCRNADDDKLVPLPKHWALKQSRKFSKAGLVAPICFLQGNLRGHRSTEEKDNAIHRVHVN